mmetsp:Transcript_32044/g.72974  ORF Transcript_32044/g.72974 Transcript_32044/m.72974 type:complete len:248 (+) Transcript_32044:100-843(+)
MVAFAKSSETRRERMLVPHSTASKAANLPPAFSACLIWLMITAAVLCRISARSRRRAAMSASAARMSATTLSGTARLLASSLLVVLDAKSRVPEVSAKAPAGAPSLRSQPCSQEPTRDWRRSDSSRKAADLLSHVLAQSFSKRSSFVCNSIASTSSLTGCSACRRRDRSLASASSMRISTWQQFTSTSRIQFSRGSVADSSFWTIRCAPCLIISRTQALSCRPLLTRPSVSYNFSSLTRLNSRRRTL